MTAHTDTWTRIDQANKAGGWPNDWTVAERDQIEALADDLNRELLIEVSKIPRVAGHGRAGYVTSSQQSHLAKLASRRTRCA